MRETPNCPLCGQQLNRVIQGPNGMLNSEQFDSVKAGDWYCESCKGNEARTGFKYFWDSELTGRSALGVSRKRRIVFEFDERSACTMEEHLKETGTTLEDYISVAVIKDGVPATVLILKKLQ